MLDNIRHIIKQTKHLAVEFYFPIQSNPSNDDSESNNQSERDSEEILLLKCTKCNYEFFNQEYCPVCKEDKLTILAESTRLGF